MQTRHHIIHRHQLRLTGLNSFDPSFDLRSPPVLRVRIYLAIETLDKLSDQPRAIDFA